MTTTPGALIVGTPGDDTLIGTSGDDTIQGLGGNDVILGQGGNDVLEGGDGNDSIDGGAGNDTLRPGAGAATLSGGGGNDSFETDDGAGSIFVDLVGGFASGAGITATLIQVQNLDLGSGNDTAMGDGADNRIDGGAGNDDLTGLEGADTIVGGDGNDTLDGGADNDVLIPGDGVDTVTLGTGINTLDLSQGGQNILINSPSPTFIDDFGTVNVFTDPLNLINVIAGGGNDVIALDGGDNLIMGGAGNDSLLGREGSDTIVAGEDEDSLFGGNGDDELAGESGNDQILGGDGSDIIDAGDDSDSMHGDAGDDQVAGGGGNDLIFGGDGSDTIDGGEGNDSVDGNDGDDVIDGGDGDDNLIGAAGEDTLIGGAGNNTLTGSFDNDLLVPGSGNNSIAGGDGFDTVTFNYFDGPITVIAGSDGTRTVQHDGNQSDTVSPSVESVRGTGFDDTFDLGAGANTIGGSLGIFDGRRGNDTFMLGSNTIGGAASQATIIGGDGFNTAQFVKYIGTYNLKFASPLRSGGSPNILLGYDYRFADQLSTTVSTPSAGGYRYYLTGKAGTLVFADDSVTVPLTIGVDPLTVVREDAGTADVVVSLSRAAQAPVFVFVSTEDGDAAAGTEYGAVNAVTIQFAPGETEKTVTIPIIDNDLVQPARSFGVRLFSPLTGVPETLAVSADILGAVTILDDDTPDPPASSPTTATLSFNTLTFGEIDGPGDVDVFAFDANAGETVVLSTTGVPGQAGGILIPRVRILDLLGQEVANDGGSPAFSFTPQTTGTFFGEFRDDSSDLVDRGFFQAILGRSVDFPIVDLVDVAGVETNAQQTGIVFAARLDRPWHEDVTVTVSTLDMGTAVPGVDFSPLAQDVTIPAGDTLGFATVTVLSNDDAELPETFSVQLTNLTNANPGAQTVATGTILDDDDVTPPAIDGVTFLRTLGDTNGDTLVGTDRSDSMEGGGGRDLLIGGLGRDILFGDDDGDLLIAGSFPSFAGAPPPGPQFDDPPDAGDILEGGNGNDTAFGSPQDDSVFGGEGDDFLVGAAGDDLLGGGIGNDVGFAEAGNDTIHGGDGNDFLFADLSPATAATSVARMDAGPGNDRVHFNATDAFAGGGPGIFDVALPVDVPDGFVIDLGASPNQNATGGGVALSGFEAVDASLASNPISVTGAAATIFLDSGPLVVGNVLFGGLFGDTLIGSDAPDIILGSQGADSLAGGAGDDTVIADAGNDTVDGGAGADDIFYPDAPFAGAVVVTGFAAVDDTLLLSASFGLTPQQALAQLQQVGADAVLTLPGAGRSIALVGVQATSLSALDVELV